MGVRAAGGWAGPGWAGLGRAGPGWDPTGPGPGGERGLLCASGARRFRGPAGQALAPPSTVSVVPVTNEASSLAR